LYEGEGSLSYTGRQWDFKIGMTDFDVLESFHAAVKCGTLNGPYRYSGDRSHCKPYWLWRTRRPAEIFNLVAEFYPYMGERRRAKFDEFLTTYGN
jgi:hypothetical protein